MSMKDSDLLLGKYVRIEFDEHVFYVPLVPSNIYFEGNSLSIDMADMDTYTIVDGIRCYYCLIYDANNGILQAWLKDWKLDGVMCPTSHEFSFPIDAKEFPFGQRDTRLVVPKRDYTEVTSAFLEQHEELDERISEFLKKHPELFEQVERKCHWQNLNDLLKSGDFDADILEDYLPRPVERLFMEEVLNK